VSAAKRKGTAAESAVVKPCKRCGGEKPTKATLYCAQCARDAYAERTRNRQEGRKRPCVRCNGPKEIHRGARFCAACREIMQPAWKQADLERGRRRSAAKAAGREPKPPKVVAPKPQKRVKQSTYPEGQRWCARCSSMKPEDRFPTRGANRRAAYCTPCSSEHGFERRLLRHYDMTVEDYDLMFERQGGRCAICMRRPRTRRLAVDHDHGSGEIRGLLCSRCNNKVLGGSGESASLLRRAASYLERPPARTLEPIEGLGHADAQQLAAFIEEADRVADGDVVIGGNQVAISARSFEALARVAGQPLLIEGEMFDPKPPTELDRIMAGRVRETFLRLLEAADQ
jgi:hypothetical protein